MNMLIVIIIIISGITNMIADVLLVSGKDFKDENQSRMEALKKTPDKHLILSGMLGLLSIIFWFTPLYYLAHLPHISGFLTMLFFVIYIAVIITFHVICTYSFLMIKYKEECQHSIKKILTFYTVMCIIFSALYTSSMLYLSFTNRLSMNFIHYLTLPFFSTTIFQFILSKLFKKIPHFSSVAGTLSMIVSLLSTVHIMLINNI